jgi:hypothetical protein
MEIMKNMESLTEEFDQIGFILTVEIHSISNYWFDPRNAQQYHCSLEPSRERSID